MAQISLYIDDETLHKIEKAAKSEQVSISKWVSNRIKHSFKQNWDVDFFNLYGSIADESFQKPQELNFSEDLKREKL